MGLFTSFAMVFCIAGPHTVTIKAKGYADFSDTINAPAGESLLSMFTLEKESPSLKMPRAIYLLASGMTLM